ncbi:unnamed protein product [Linum trigynum]|uniref:Uncharacterized protein n=1 Tax=Linum trigynum TaxID=586398 RepID=A0AAV2G7N0_9ROSI
MLGRICWAKGLLVSRSGAAGIGLKNKKEKAKLLVDGTGEIIRSREQGRQLREEEKNSLGGILFLERGQEFWGKREKRSSAGNEEREAQRRRHQAAIGDSQIGDQLLSNGLS